MLISMISVLEIKSATTHTKFHGFGGRQLGFLAVGLVLMFVISFMDYHRLVEFCALGLCGRPLSHWSRLARGRHQGQRRQTLD